MKVGWGCGEGGMGVVKVGWGVVKVGWGVVKVGWGCGEGGMGCGEGGMEGVVGYEHELTNGWIDEPQENGTVHCVYAGLWKVTKYNLHGHTWVIAHVGVASGLLTEYKTWHTVLICSGRLGREERILE